MFGRETGPTHISTVLYSRVTETRLRIMSNTAVLFNALQPQASLQHHHHHITTTTNRTMKMYNNSNSPSRRTQGTKFSTVVETVAPKSTNSTNEHSIRRGAEIVRKHIQQQQHHVMTNKTTTTPMFHVDVDDDEFIIHDSDEEVTTEDHISVTSWSEYDVPSAYYATSRRNNGTASSVEIDPPSVSDWSIDVDDLDDDDDNEANQLKHQPIIANAEEKEEENDDDSLLLEESHLSKRDHGRNVHTLRSHHQRQQVPPPISNYDNTTMLMMTMNEKTIAKHTPVDKFISSDDDDDDDEKVEEVVDDKKEQDDYDDSNSDIVEISDALFDPFQYSSSHGHDLAAGVVSSSSPNKISKKLLSTTIPTTGTNVLNCAKEQRSPSNTNDGGDGTKRNNSGSDSSPYRHHHRTVGLSTSPSSDAIKKGYPLPFQIQKSSPDYEKNTDYTTSTNGKNGIETTNNRPNFFMDYDIDAYCGYNADRFDDNDDELYDSPDKPVREVPIYTPSTMSNLSSPGMTQPQHRPISYNTSHVQKSSAVMIQYDQLLRDPAYLHAQNAGFIWQSVVGQHIRFPSTWWNGARGPPINSGYDNNSNQHHHHPADTSNIPWMYFGRHTIPDHPVLNQLVKCRASAGRLLLHIVVQDLMTRTPIQDIVIGCFHPNSKGIRSPNSPALKRYENCRDVWMAVRKRNHTAVAATDSLMYSPSHWENPKASSSCSSTRRSATSSAYNYSISRSPLGSGQRVTNQNVRAVFGDKAPLETIFLSEDELYERLATRILQQQQNVLLLSASGINNAKSSNNDNNINSKQNTSTAASVTSKYVDISPAYAILQELVFA